LAVAKLHVGGMVATEFEEIERLRALQKTTMKLQ